MAVSSMLSKGYRKKVFLDDIFLSYLKKKPTQCQMRESDEKVKQKLAEKKKVNLKKEVLHQI